MPRFAIAPLGLTTEGSTKFKPKGWKCYLKKLQWKGENISPSKFDSVMYVLVSIHMLAPLTAAAGFPQGGWSGGPADVAGPSLLADQRRPRPHPSQDNARWRRVVSRNARHGVATPAPLWSAPAISSFGNSLASGVLLTSLQSTCAFKPP